MFLVIIPRVPTEVQPIKENARKKKGMERTIFITTPSLGG
jgi:hypothetical protein